MPGVELKSPLSDLIRIELSTGPSQDKGKGRGCQGDGQREVGKGKVG
jgi:hypothetical protein